METNINLAERVRNAFPVDPDSPFAKNVAYLNSLRPIPSKKTPRTVREGAVYIKTTHNANHIELYGPNRVGVKIPVEHIGDAILDLTKTCTNPKETYTFGRVGTSERMLEIPGHVLNWVTEVLARARDAGRDLASYDMVLQVR